MDYEIIGPCSYNFFLEEGLVDKCTTAEQTIDILSEMIFWLGNLPHSEEYLYLMEEKKNYGKIISLDKFAKINEQKENIEKCLSGNIFTSTMLKGIPNKGIKIKDDLIPFGNYAFFYATPTKKMLKKHEVIRNSFSSHGLKKFYKFLSLNNMKINCFGKGQDSGKEWESRITFDIDFKDNYFLFNFDDPFYSAMGPNEYRTFVLK